MFVGGMCVTVSMVTAVLKFFSEVSSEGLMKDWLGGADGNIFWPVLLTMLCNTPLQSTIAAAAFPNKLEVGGVLCCGVLLQRSYKLCFIYFE